MLDSKRIRERDKNRARDILLKRDRDSEGDLFADKEMFVTSAYKKQQEEIEKQDQEDREKGKHYYLQIFLVSYCKFESNHHN